MGKPKQQRGSVTILRSQNKGKSYSLDSDTLNTKFVCLITKATFFKERNKKGNITNYYQIYPQCIFWM